MRVRQLSDGELVQARQFLVRNWSVPAGRFVLQPLSTAGRDADPPPGLPAPPPLPRAEDTAPGSFRAAREDYDRRLVAAALEQAGGNLSEASRRLGISRNTLKAKLRLYGL